MNKTEQAQQLRLAAEIIETGHPWEIDDNAGGGFRKPFFGENPCKAAFINGKIRLAFVTPPDGRPLHNPDNLTAEQVGAGWRLLLASEMQGGLPPSHPGHHKCEGWKAGKWYDEHSNGSVISTTYRLPLSVPWPEAPKPELAFQLPLGPEDVPPGTVLRGAGEAKNYDGGWCIITSCSRTGIRIWRECDSNPTEITWRTIKDAKSEINRSIPLTGKWDANAWEPCHKTLANG